MLPTTPVIPPIIVNTSYNSVCKKPNTTIKIWAGGLIDISPNKAYR